MLLPATTRARLERLTLSVAVFAAGCGLAALLYAQVGKWCFCVLPLLGAFRTSMLQDVDAGRALELDALVGAVREIGQRVGVATPAIDALFGLARLFGRVRGLYPPGSPAGKD